MSDAVQVPALITGRKATGIVPTSIEEVFRLAQAVAKSGLAPSTMRTAEALTVAIMHGLELGLPPMMAIQNIAVVNGKPTLWGSAVPALLWSRGFKIKETVSDNVATCTVTRPGADGAKITRTFSEADARKAGLWGKAGPWQQYPSRMLQMRARGLAARDGAADALSGLYLQEELDGGELTVVSIEDAPKRKSSAEAKRDGTKETFDNLMRAIEAAPEASDLLTLRQEHAETWAAMPSRWANLLNESFHYKAKDFGVDVDPDTGAIVDQATE
jgi:hypothetical protein